MYGILYTLYLYIKYDYYIYLHGWEGSTSRKWLNCNSKLTINMKLLFLYKVYTYPVVLSQVFVAGIRISTRRNGKVYKQLNFVCYYIIMCNMSTYVASTSVCETTVISQNSWPLQIDSTEIHHKVTTEIHHKVTTEIHHKVTAEIWKDMTSHTI